MNVTLWGWFLGKDLGYEWRTNTYYQIGVPENVKNKIRRAPDVACQINLSCFWWLDVLDDLLVLGKQPCVWMPDNSKYPLPLIGEIDTYDHYYGRKEHK